ncbi:hypothetical protein LY16_02391 [Xenorhabdus doucetiae]|uniref:Uncharacterized protein n=1 Tax=Xenorhabdus doucetiae TaxID=351671 RepID=A0ABY3NQC2_9GAMM|nr:hypothetical protein LY16_02391 [Xenorhabdus doucetiae]
MIFILLRAVQFVFLYLIFAVVSYFFVLDRSLKKTIILSLFLPFIFTITQISSFILAIIPFYIYDVISK